MQWLLGLLAWWRNGLECCAAVVPRLCPHCTFIEHHAGIVEEGTEGGAGWLWRLVWQVWRKRCHRGHCRQGQLERLMLKPKLIYVRRAPSPCLTKRDSARQVPIS